VRVLDCLDGQVHRQQGWPEYLDREVEMHQGCVTDKDAVRKALDGVDRVVHLAAAVGVGQSMYEIAHYTRINNQGTAGLLEVLIENPVEKDGATRFSRTAIQRQPGPQTVGFTGQ
jgi:dTDP-L-rhamnose 4-epimerase